MTSDKLNEATGMDSSFIFTPIQHLSNQNNNTNSIINQQLNVFNNNTKNNIVNTNPLSATDAYIDCPNVRSTADFHPLLFDSITRSSPSNSDYSEHNFVSTNVPIDSHLTYSIDNNTVPSTSHSTHQMITGSAAGIVKPNPKYTLITNCHPNNKSNEPF